MIAGMLQSLSDRRDDDSEPSCSRLQSTKQPVSTSTSSNPTASSVLRSPSIHPESCHASTRRTRSRRSSTPAPNPYPRGTNECATSSTSGCSKRSSTRRLVRRPNRVSHDVHASKEACVATGRRGIAELTTRLQDAQNRVFRHPSAMRWRSGLTPASPARNAPPPRCWSVQTRVDVNIVVVPRPVRKYDRGVPGPELMNVADAWRCQNSVCALKAHLDIAEMCMERVVAGSPAAEFPNENHTASTGSVVTLQRR